MEHAVAEREMRGGDMGLKLYRISQAVNTEYDTYDSAVVVAENEEDARRIHPDGTGAKWSGETWEAASVTGIWTWCPPKHVKVEFVGVPDDRFKSEDVVCASFNAG